MRYDYETDRLWIGERFWQGDPSESCRRDLEHDGRLLTRMRRCVVSFETGWSASILWGDGTYSSNNRAWSFYDDGPLAQPFTEEPSTVEVGVLDHRGALRQRRFVDEDGTFSYSAVEGYLDDAELADLLDRLAVLPTDFDYGEEPPSLEEVEEAMRAVQRLTGELPS